MVLKALLNESCTVLFLTPQIEYPLKKKSLFVNLRR